MKIISVNLECTVGTSNKFWHGEVHLFKDRDHTKKTKFVASYGRIGGTAQTNTIVQPTPYGAFNTLAKKIAEKLAKGYVFVGVESANLKSKELEYEKDLQAAAGRFFVSAKRFAGWIEPKIVEAGVMRVETTEDGDSPIEPNPQEQPPESIKAIMEQRRRRAVVSI